MNDAATLSDVNDTRPLMSINLEWVDEDGPHKHSFTTRYATVGEIRLLDAVCGEIGDAIVHREGLLTEADLDG